MTVDKIPDLEAEESIAISWENFRRRREFDPEWQKDNLEYDLRSNKELCNKVKSNEIYAQNLYAALCNNQFQHNETWNIISDQRWSCSWRYAGGIVADMCERGDYLDWYCSGIGFTIADIEVGELTVEQQEEYSRTKYFVSEGTVTEEVAKDLFKLGWIVVEDNRGD